MGYRNSVFHSCSLRTLPRLLFALALTSIVSLLSITCAIAGTPNYPDILPVNKIHAGMKGYGLTTFHGVEISRFSVTVIGVLKQANIGHDLILIRMSGGPITKRGANLIHGMSGSPVYIDGKIIGAFSQGEQWPKEPIGMVTPIQDMLEAWDPNIPQKPDYFQPADLQPKSTTLRLKLPISVAGRRVSKIELGARESQSSSESTAVLHYATSFLYAPGAKEANCLWLQKALEAKGLHYTVVSDGGAAGGVSAFKAPPLRPGSCFGTMLAQGDIPFGGYGTLTYRKGDRVLGFGHPLMGLGALEGAITTAYVVDVFSGLQTSHLIPIAGPIVGTLRQDRDFSVSGDLSSKPHLVSFDVTVNDAITHRSQTFHEKLLQHPELTPQLMAFVAKEAISRVHDIPGDVMARVTTSITAAEIGTLTRTNTVFDSVDLTGPALLDLSEITGIASGNPFYPLPIRSGKLTIDIKSGHETAAVDRIFLKQSKFAPGDTVEVGVVLKPYRRPNVTRVVAIKIPDDTPAGRYQLQIRGGQASSFRFGGITFGGASEAGTPPVNAKQMAKQFSERESNTDIVARLMLNTYVPAIAGERLSQMPPNLAALMRSERNSSVRLEREDIRKRVSTGWVVSGTQQLQFTVVRNDSQEQSSSNAPLNPLTPGSGNSPLPGIPPPGASAGALNDDPTDAEVLSLKLGSPAVSSELARWMTALSGELPQATSPGAPSAAPPKSGTKQTNGSGFKVFEPGSVNTANSDTSSDKPVGRKPAISRQSARTDLSSGKFTGTGVTAAGELRLSQSLHRFTTSDETYIWSLAADRSGNLYAGTGTGGKLLKIDSAGKVTTFATLPALTVQALLVAHDGTLWAGTGAEGAIYHFSSDGKPTLVRTLKERYVLTLAQDSLGTIYIGVGGGGVIYRLTTDEQRSARPTEAPSVFYTTNSKHIMTLAVDSNGNLLAGGAPDGVLYRISRSGQGKALFDAKDNAIMAVGAGPNGSAYVATGPKGIVYQVQSDGSSKMLYDRAPNFYTALKTASDGSLYASTATSIYHITPEKNGSQPVVVPLENSHGVDYLSMAIMPGGIVAAGTGNVGEVYESGNAEENAHLTGSYTSVVRDAKLRARWGVVRLDASAPKQTEIRILTRTGDVAEPDATWSAWSLVSLRSGRAEGAVTSPAARFIQYKLELSGAGDSPVIRDVSLSYMPQNQAPHVSFVTPSDGEYLAHTQTVRWSASDPDNDTLTYTLEYSCDSGATWHAVASSTSQKQPGPATGAASVAAAMAEFEKQLDPSIPPFLKQIALDKHRAILEGTDKQGSDQRDSFRSWDTNSLADGSYLLRVTASDSPGNPEDPQTAQAISVPFTICNAPPVIKVAGKPDIHPDRTVSVRGIASQNLAAITAVQYKADGGDWTAAIAEDGLFDSGKESFHFNTAALSAGTHIIEISAFNSAGEHVSIKVNINVP